MRDHSALATGEARRLQPPALADAWMTHRIGAAEDAMQAADTNCVFDRSLAKPQGAQLLTRYDTVLRSGQPSKASLEIVATFR